MKKLFSALLTIALFVGGFATVHAGINSGITPSALFYLSGTTILPNGSWSYGGAVSGTVTIAGDTDFHGFQLTDVGKISATSLTSTSTTVSSFAGALGIGTTTPNATFYLYGSFGAHATSTAVSGTVATSTDFIMLVTDTSSARTVTLPICNTSTLGNLYRVKDASGAAGTNNITVTPIGSDTIDGGATKAISTNYGAFDFFCGSSGKWYIF